MREKFHKRFLQQLGHFIRRISFAAPKTPRGPRAAALASQLARVI
jgi:hypothetical protein